MADKRVRKKGSKSCRGGHKKKRTSSSRRHTNQKMTKSNIANSDEKRAASETFPAHDNVPEHAHVVLRPVSNDPSAQTSRDIAPTNTVLVNSQRRIKFLHAPPQVFPRKVDPYFASPSNPFLGHESRRQAIRRGELSPMISVKGPDTLEASLISVKGPGSLCWAGEVPFDKVNLPDPSQSENNYPLSPGCVCSVNRMRGGKDVRRAKSFPRPREKNMRRDGYRRRRTFSQCTLSCVDSLRERERIGVFCSLCGRDINVPKASGTGSDRLRPAPTGAGSDENLLSVISNISRMSLVSHQQPSFIQSPQRQEITFDSGDEQCGGLWSDEDTDLSQLTQQFSTHSPSSLRANSTVKSMEVTGSGSPNPHHNQRDSPVISIIEMGRGHTPDYSGSGERRDSSVVRGNHDQLHHRSASPEHTSEVETSPQSATSIGKCPTKPSHSTYVPDFGSLNGFTMSELIEDEVVDCLEDQGWDLEFPHFYQHNEFKVKAAEQFLSQPRTSADIEEIRKLLHALLPSHTGPLNGLERVHNLLAVDKDTRVVLVRAIFVICQYIMQSRTILPKNHPKVEVELWCIDMSTTQGNCIIGLSLTGYFENPRNSLIDLWFRDDPCCVNRLLKLMLFFEEQIDSTVSLIRMYVFDAEDYGNPEFEGYGEAISSVHTMVDWSNDEQQPSILLCPFSFPSGGIGFDIGVEEMFSRPLTLIPFILYQMQKNPKWVISFIGTRKHTTLFPPIQKIDVATEEHNVTGQLKTSSCTVAFFTAETICDMVHEMATSLRFTQFVRSKEDYECVDLPLAVVGSFCDPTRVIDGDIEEREENMGAMMLLASDQFGVPIKLFCRDQLTQTILDKEFKLHLMHHGTKVMQQWTSGRGVGFSDLKEAIHTTLAEEQHDEEVGEQHQK